MQSIESHTAPAASVLFVCLGNICRSPLAEGVFLHLLEEEGLADRVQVDSAGTGSWHVGEPPDRRSAEVALRNGITLAGTARQVAPEDLWDDRWVVAMDRSNLRDLRELSLSRDAGGAALHLLREFDPAPRDEDGMDVPDPYHSGPRGFDRIYEIIDRSCRTLLERIREEHGL